MARLCSFLGCDREHQAKGLCNGHYGQFQQGKQLRPLKVVIHRMECSFPGCGKPHLSKGFCRGHWDQQYRGVPLRPLKTIAPPGLYEKCQFPGCDGEHEAKGFCAIHYERYRRKGDPSWDRSKTIAEKRPNPGDIKKLKFGGHCEDFVFLPHHRLATKTGWVRLARIQFEQLSGHACDHTDRISMINEVPTNRNKFKRLFACPFCSELFTGMASENRKYCSIACAAGHRFNKTIDGILEIRLSRASGETIYTLENQFHLPESTLRGIVSGRTFRQIPYQKKGQSFDEYYMEAMAYRSRNTQPRGRQECLPNSGGSAESLEK